MAQPLFAGGEHAGAGGELGGIRSLCRRFSFAPSGLVHFPLFTHGLRPFDKLRASCGLHSCAASRLGSGGSLMPLWSAAL